MHIELCVFVNVYVHVHVQFVRCTKLLCAISLDIEILLIKQYHKVHTSLYHVLKKILLNPQICCLLNCFVICGGSSDVIFITINCSN